MISSQVSMFYRKVIKDFIGSLEKNQSTVMELEQNNVYLNQIQEKMFQKIEHTDSLLKRLINNHNQIEKQMQHRYATLTSDPSLTPRHPSLISEDSSIREMNEFSSSNPSNDIRTFHAAQAVRQAPLPLISTSDSRRLDCHEIEQSEEMTKKRPAADYSVDDISEIGQDHNECFRRLREVSKIHILGTYDTYSKKHSFKMDKTEVTLSNVFVKVEGIGKEIFLSSLHCTTRKRIHK